MVLEILAARFAFKPVLLALKQIVKLPDEVEKSVSILLPLDHRAQLVHAFFFVWSHGKWDGRRANAAVLRRRY